MAKASKRHDAQARPKMTRRKARASKPTKVSQTRHRAEPSRRRSPEDQRSAWCLRDQDVERALETGEYARELEELFGPSEYAELRQLAAEANRRSNRGGPRVLILPGIMGSKLGERSKLLGLFPRDDVYWVDPLDVMLGRISRLVIGADRQIQPLGVFLIAYAKLKLRLRALGYDADYYPFDWRLSIPTLGAQLSRSVKALGVPVSIVAHSMGGLVSRAAIHQGAKIERLIQLGTPNFGSYAPLLALRGVDSNVKKLAALDLSHDRSDLISKVLRGFPGLLEMLPSLPGDAGAVFFDPKQWPTDAAKPMNRRFLAPDVALLQSASAIQQHLQPADPSGRWTLIAGVNQQTVTGATFDTGRDEVVFECTPDGDGTVPLRFAQIPGLHTLYVEESHGQLANNRQVAAAVADLLDRGATDRLPAERPLVRGARKELVPEHVMRAIDPFAGALPEAPSRAGRREGVRADLRAADLRGVLSGFVAPGASDAPQAPPSGPVRVAGDLTAAHAPWNRMVVGRARQHRIDIQIANCNIAQVSARAYVLGLFREVTPSGAAAYVDSRLDGAITEFTRRRMFSGGVGEVFILPANRSRLRADMVLFAGLGYFDQFNDEVQQTAAEQVIRTFVRTRVEDFATVLFGGSSGSDVSALLINLLKGFVRGKLDADVDHRFRCVTICELDKTRYETIREELFRLSGTPLFEEIEVTFTELPPPPPEPAAVEAPSSRAHTDSGRDPVYLIVRRDRETATEIEFSASLLTAGAKAAIMTGSQVLKANALETALARTSSPRFTEGDGKALGTYLGAEVLPDRVKQVLLKHRNRHLVVVHDGPSSRLPWETLRFGDWAPALGAEAGMSRRYMADNLSVAKYLEERVQGAKVRLLLVVNPTEDLEGAQREGVRLKALFEKRTDVEIYAMEGPAATRRALLDELGSGRYDLVHYAGHAFFDAELPERSGLLCSGGVPLTGVDLSAIGNLPKLVFFNACESGRVRRSARGSAKLLKQASMSKADLRRERVAPAEAYLRGGVANFIGTYWPVGDASAATFSESLYALLLQGATLGDAVLGARQAVEKDGSIDWADYVHYGDYRFKVRP